MQIFLFKMKLCRKLLNIWPGSVKALKLNFKKLNLIKFSKFAVKINKLNNKIKIKIKLYNNNNNKMKV